MLLKYLKHFTFSSCFWSIVIVTGDGCLEHPNYTHFNTEVGANIFFRNIHL